MLFLGSRETLFLRKTGGYFQEPGRTSHAASLPRYSKLMGLPNVR
jgi:hypothetical protein